LENEGGAVERLTPDERLAPEGTNTGTNTDTNTDTNTPTNTETDMPEKTEEKTETDIIADRFPLDEAANLRRAHEAEVARLKRDHAKTVKHLAHAVYHKGTEHGLCHDGLVEFICTEFGSECVPIFTYECTITITVNPSEHEDEYAVERAMEDAIANIGDVESIYTSVAS
jgi:hypothetical protein